MKCDFCASLAVVWEYPAKSFTLPIPDARNDWGSEGSWAACEACHSLIERDRRIELTAHSFASIPQPVILSIIAEQGEGAILAFIESLNRAHEGFFANRLGPARRVASA